MTQANPYQPPKAKVATAADASGDIERIASGQKLVIYAIALNFLAIALQFAVGPVAVMLVGIVALILSFVGILRIASGMDLSIVAKIFLVLLMFVPLINLITLLVLNGRATRRLRAAGYTVGLLGASR